MKKLMLILVFTGVLISCSSKDEIIKKETVAEVAVENETTTLNEKAIEVENPEVTTVEVEKFILTDEDYKTVSEPVKKIIKKVKPTPKIVKKEMVIEEKVVPIEVAIETSVDKDLDKDVDELIAMTETEAKVVEEETPKEENSSNKTLFGILGAILVAGAAVFVFKKK